MKARARIEVRFAGHGGQGIVMAGAILGEAVSLAGKQAACSSTYGSQARGGVTRADVVIAQGGFIDFPHVTRPWILAAMSQESYEAFLPTAADDGIVITDSAFVTPDASDARMHLVVEATRISLEVLGKPQAANVVMLGAVAAFGSLVDMKFLRSMVGSTFPGMFREANEKALEIGAARGFELSRREGI